jgi:hypothetical protein
MQKRLSKGDCGVVGGSGSAAASRIISGCLPASPVGCGRFYSPKRCGQKNDGQYGSDRQIAPQAVKYLEERLAGYNKLNNTRRRAVFRAAQLLSHYDHKNGAKLPQRSFSSGEAGRWIQEGLIESDSAYCIDWNSWKPTHFDFKNAKPRAFFPCVEFLFLDTGYEVVSTFGDYVSDRVQMRAPLHDQSDSLSLCASSGIFIPSNVAEAMRAGTGLRCDVEQLRRLVMDLTEELRAQKLCAALASVGRVEFDELRPLWEQHEWGRIYASKPAVLNMPKVLLSSLRSVDGLPLWEVDFSSFELRVASKLTGQILPEGDVYDLIADRAGISRGRVKDVINPFLHGQRIEQCWYSKKPNSTLAADHPLVEREMKIVWPYLIDGFDALRKDDSILQREGARIFFRCMGEAMQEAEITSAGLPKHDGWVFGGTEEQAKVVRGVFEQEAERLTGSQFPVKCREIA